MIVRLKSRAAGGYSLQYLFFLPGSVHSIEKVRPGYSGRDDSHHGGARIVPIDHCGRITVLAAAQPMKWSALISLGCFPIKILSRCVRSNARLQSVDVGIPRFVLADSSHLCCTGQADLPVLFSSRLSVNQIEQA